MTGEVVGVYDGSVVECRTESSGKRRLAGTPTPVDSDQSDGSRMRANGVNKLREQPLSFIHNPSLSDRKRRPPSAAFMRRCKVSQDEPRLCSVDSCHRAAVTRGWCQAHYRRFRRTGSVDADRPIGAKKEPPQCSVDGCVALATERGWCHGHYLRWVRLGDVLEARPLSRKVNFDCEVDRCDRPAEIRGLCRTNANRKRKYGDVQADKPIRAVPGTGFVNHGYRYIPVPLGLRHLSDGETPYPEHRLAMAQLLGRPLTADESVHHINGDRTDNRTDGPLVNFRSGNLELWSRWQPSGQRVTDKIEFAIELLERYLPEALAEQLPLNLLASE